MERLLSLYIATLNRIDAAMRDEEGQTMVEYALVIALVVIAIAGALTVTGLTGKITSTFTALSNKFT
jgi:Flp pilus assembly pilin Flp